MPFTIPANRVSLLFKSLASISEFKHECSCGDFYINRDELTLVGSFTEEQVAIAIDKFEAVLIEVVDKA